MTHTRAGRLLVTLASAVAVAMSAANTAAADPAAGREVVVLGDSYTSNGWDWSFTNTCVRGQTSWPNQLSGRLGLAGSPDFLDESCTGATIDSGHSTTLLVQARSASQAAAFGPRTKLVALQFGLNDKWGTNDMTVWSALGTCLFNLVDGCGLDAAQQGRITDYHAVSGELYAERIRTVVEYIQYYAPSARIVLVGYPELFPPGQQTLCFDFFGMPFVQPRGAALTVYLDRLDQAQRKAAQLLGIEFFDARAVTAGHGLCTAEPWVNGFLDPKVNQGVAFHPSAAGDAAVADGLAALAGR
ncbi:SGNH/GDSL hydrolase family protein [Nocardia arthritidis]|uniref:SGNH/GDSL hydrolase family protein n=1 Tax=Nocardia arthritidis TaxID=228602 RepID=UPI00142D5539|nr:SGNH/GDSL hydrolase family protein [Nocardia arthritidis]